MNEEQPLWSWGSRARGTTGELGRDFVLFLAFDIEDWTAGAETLGLGTSKQEEKLSMRDPMIFLPFLRGTHNLMLAEGPRPYSGPTAHMH